MNTPDFNSFFFGDSSSQFSTIETDDFQDMFLDGDVAHKENISPSPAVRSVIVIPPSSTSTSTSTVCSFIIFTFHFCCLQVQCLSSSLQEKKILTRHWKEIHSKKYLFMKCPVKSCTYGQKGYWTSIVTCDHLTLVGFISRHL